MSLLDKLLENTGENLVNAPMVTATRSGETFAIGDGFKALAFRAKDFSGAMDPLVMVDHYRMTKSTFGAHPHAGLSAVSLIFEDSTGRFHNRDSLGNDFDIMPGDLYWLQAGSGVIHDEAPRDGANIHGLQVFVNMPAADRTQLPTSLYVKASDMPSIKCEGCRVRVVLGESNGVMGQQSPAIPMTILDGYLDTNATFSHPLKESENAWLNVIKGELIVMVGDKQVKLFAGQAIAISDVIAGAKSKVYLANPSNEMAHFTLFAAKPVNEAYVQKGPFIMSSQAEIVQAEANYLAGKFGLLAQ